MMRVLLLPALVACTPADREPIESALVAAAVPSTIQELQDGTVPSGTEVSLSRVFVTASRLSGGGARLAFLQAPDGVTSGGHPYPQYAGVQLFGSMAETTTFPALASLAIGDCISISAKVEEFQGGTELLAPTAVTVEAPGTCGAAPTPLVISPGTVAFDSIATDTAPDTLGDQHGAQSEIYEGVLVTVTGVVALARTDPQTGTFLANPGGAPASGLLVGSFVYADANGVQVQAGQAFTSMTGVFTEHVRFTLYPRTAADLQ